MMDQYQMLDHIKSHSLVVASVAYLIATSLRNTGITISLEKVVAGALMHDIGKTPSLESGEDHSILGKRICLENNLDEIANIVAEHVRLKNHSMNGGLSEKEIVFYSDKRVKHDQIVSLDERLADILERYGKDNKERCRAIRVNFEQCKKVERKLFNRLGFSAKRLADFVKIIDCLREKKMFCERLNGKGQFKGLNHFDLNTLEV